MTLCLIFGTKDAPSKREARIITNKIQHSCILEIVLSVILCKTGNTISSKDIHIAKDIAISIICKHIDLADAHKVSFLSSIHFLNVFFSLGSIIILLLLLYFQIFNYFSPSPSTVQQPKGEQFLSFHPAKVQHYSQIYKFLCIFIRALVKSYPKPKCITLIFCTLRILLEAKNFRFFLLVCACRYTIRYNKPDRKLMRPGYLFNSFPLGKDLGQAYLSPDCGWLFM